VDKDVKNIGVEVVDVRLKRVDLVPEISSDVYRRMEAERKRVANELRSTGSAEGERIKADADRQKQIIVAEAYRDAQRIKGEGDAQAARIYAEASGAIEFYSFYRPRGLRTTRWRVWCRPARNSSSTWSRAGSRARALTTVRGFRAHAGDRGILPFVAPAWRETADADRDEGRPDSLRGGAVHAWDRTPGSFHDDRGPGEKGLSPHPSLALLSPGRVGVRAGVHPRPWLVQPCAARCNSSPRDRVRATLAASRAESPLVFLRDRDFRQVPPAGTSGRTSSISLRVRSLVVEADGGQHAERTE
jgi:hypothetical protein